MRRLSPCVIYFVTDQEILSTFIYSVLIFLSPRLLQPNGKISCTGEAKTHFASAPPVNFEVRSGISYSNRGHVLTFPGLEVSLNSDIGLFVPVHPTLDLDVGHNTKFRSIVIDGRKKRVKIAASVTITPDRTRLMTQDYVQTSEAFAAIFFYDVGQWLTRLGRFSK